MVAECVEKLITLMKQKYEKMVEIDNLTKDLENAMKRNDNVSTEMFLKMRSKVMQAIDGIDEEADEIINSGDEELYHYLRSMLQVKTQEQATNTEFEDEKLLMLISLRIRNVLEGILEKDKLMHKRILGKDSFYEKNK